MKKQYFAAIQEETEYLDELNQKISKYYDYLESSGLMSLWKRAYLAYYGGDLTSETSLFASAKLGKAGKLNEITKIKVNKYRSLVKYALNIATSNKTNLTPVASNSDAKSQQEVVLAKSLVSYYVKEQDVGSQQRLATEYACLQGFGHIYIPWLPEKGDIYSVDENGKPTYTGDLEAKAYRAIDVVQDHSSKGNSTPWKMVKVMENRYELIAKHPDLADRIESYEADPKENKDFDLLPEESNEDFIPVWHFHHEKTPALPQGRITLFSGDIVYFDGATPYDELPIVTIKADNLHGTPFGYSPFNDLLSLQQAADNLASMLVTNNMAFGTQYIFSKDESITPRSLGGGLTLISGEEAPVGINLTKSAPESYSLLNSLFGWQSDLSGINQAMQGNTPAGASGSLAAVLIAQSLQFTSGLQESHNKLLEKVGSLIISHLQTFAKTPRLALIVGEANRPAMREFSNKDLSTIKRITIEETSPMSNTISGRVTMADALLEKGLITANQYITIVNGGSLDNATFGVQASEINIKSENEALQNGMPIKALLIDDPMKHCLSHRDVISSPESRADVDLVSRTLDHIQDHLDTWMNANPIILQMLGIPLPTPEMLAQVMGQPAPQPNTQPVPNQAPPSPADVGAGQPRMPSLPANADEGTQAAYQQQTMQPPQG